MLDVWNATQCDYASERLIHHLLETQACQVPHHIALCNAQTEMSYGDLDARANRLAHHLLAQDLRPAHASRSCAIAARRWLSPCWPF